MPNLLESVVTLSMLGMVIGANLISPINTVVSAIVTPTYSAAVSSLSGLLTLIFVVIIMLMAIRSIEA